MRETGGNGLQIFKDHPEDLDKFLARWPDSLKLVSLWNKLPCLHSTMLLAELAYALTEMGDPLPAKQLTEALGWPENPQTIQEALRLAANCKQSEANRAKRPKLMAKAIEQVPGP